MPLCCRNVTVSGILDVHLISTSHLFARHVVLSDCFLSDNNPLF